MISNLWKRMPVVSLHEHHFYSPKKVCLDLLEAWEIRADFLDQGGGVRKCAHLFTHHCSAQSQGRMCCQPWSGQGQCFTIIAQRNIENFLYTDSDHWSLTQHCVCTKEYTSVFRQGIFPSPLDIPGTFKTGGFYRTIGTVVSVLVILKCSSFA